MIIVEKIDRTGKVKITNEDGTTYICGPYTDFPCSEMKGKYGPCEFADKCRSMLPKPLNIKTSFNTPD